MLCSTDYQRLRDLLDLADLRHIVHPRVKDHVGFVANQEKRDDGEGGAIAHASNRNPFDNIPRDLPVATVP